MVGDRRLSSNAGSENTLTDPDDVGRISFATLFMNRAAQNPPTSDFLNISIYRLAAFFVFIVCLLSLVDAAIPQFQLLVFREIIVKQYAVKGALLGAAVLGYALYPKHQTAGVPIVAWLVCIAYLLADMPYLHSAVGWSFSEVLLSYNAYYLLLLIGLALVAFREGVSERVIIRCTVLVFLVSAAFGIAQHITDRPILYTESPDGSFSINSWDFFGRVRAFSLFTSSMNFGMFCALCGALAVPLYRKAPLKAVLLFVVSAVACYTTLTRLCYLVFFCASSYSFVLTFGKKAGRGLWQPLLYFIMGMSTILATLFSVAGGDTGNLQDTGSLFQRIGQWLFYVDLLLHSTKTQLLFGVGIVQNESILPRYPMIIDNLPLALILHIGIVGLVLFSILLIKMWLYLRKEALATQQPFIIATASVFASLACSGIFNITFPEFGTVFALAILCGKYRPVKTYRTRLERLESERKNLGSGMIPSLEES
jgi:hypothetical protein